MRVRSLGKLLVMALAISSLIVTIGLGNLEASSTVTLVDDGEPRFVIVTSDNPSLTVTDSVNELNYWIQRISGVTLPVYTVSQWDGSTPYIAIGENELAARNGWDSGEFEQEEARVFIEEDRIGLIGNDHAPYLGVTWTGTYYAVLEFVKKELGVRWIWPGVTGEVFTERDTIEVSTGAWTWAPDITLTRGIRNMSRSATSVGPAQEYFGYVDANPGLVEAMDKLLNEQAVWLKRERMNRSTDIQFGHSFTDWWDRYGKTNPDWFARPPEGSTQLGGQGVKLNLSNPEVADQIVANWKRAWENNPGANRILRIAPNDSRGFDTRPETRAWDAPEMQKYTDREIWNGDQPILSDRYLKFWNIIARRVKEVDPDVIVTTYAYRNYRTPPLGDEQVEDNIIIGYVGGEGYYPDEPHVRDEWTGWAERGARLTWRPNLLHAGHGIPYLYSESLYNDFQYFRANNMLGTDFDAMTGNWAGQGLNYYILAELHSRPEATYEELTGEFFGAFGPASDAIKAYHEYMELKTKDVPSMMREAALVPHETWGGWWPAHIRVIPLFLTDDVIEHAESILQQAGEAVKDAPLIYRQRVDFIRTGFEHAKLMATAFRALGIENPSSPKVFKDPVKETREILQPLWDFRMAAARNYMIPVTRYLVSEQDRLRLWAPFTTESYQRETTLGADAESTEELDTGWLFTVDPQNEGLSAEWFKAGQVTDWQPVDVGMPWRQSLPQVTESKVGWYKTTVDAPELITLGKRAVLHFESVDAEVHLWVDGQLVLERGYPHMGNYDSWIQPFTVDITNYLQEGKSHTVVLRVGSESYNAGITGPVSLLIYNENLFQNPSFETTYEDDILPSWNPTVFDQVRFFLDPGVARTGTNSMIIGGTKSGADSEEPRGAMGQQVSIEPGATYQLTGRYRTDGIVSPEAVRLVVSFPDRSGDFMPISESETFDVLSVSNPISLVDDKHLHVMAKRLSDTEWNEVNLVFTAPEASYRMLVELFLWRDSGMVWWEDLSLVRVPTPRLNYIYDRFEGPREVAWFGTIYNLVAIDQSDGWGYVTDNPELHFRDPTRKIRKENTTEYIVWETPKLLEVELDVYAEDVSVADHLELSVSDDGETWHDMTYAVKRVAESEAGLVHFKITGRSPEDNMQFTKLTLNQSPSPAEIQLGNAVFKHLQ